MTTSVPVGTPRQPGTTPATSCMMIQNTGALGLATLNRPVALNALNQDMQRTLASALTRWVADPQIYAAILQSTCPRAFCVGRDILEIADWGASRFDLLETAIAEEYALIWRIECFTKPMVSLIDGLVMGSGVGITHYGTHRVGADNYAFAMPEAGIGFFPDVGATWFLSQMPDCVGVYLGLTGHRIGTADALALGLLTHCIPAARFGEIQRALELAEPVDPVLDGRHVDPGPAPLAARRGAIQRCFCELTIEAIMTRLEGERGADQPWARATLDVMSAKSPTSLKLTLRQLQKGVHLQMAGALTLKPALELEYQLAVQVFRGHDFYEGVRAVLRDKDHAPIWRPSSHAGVTDSAIDALFAPLAGPGLALPPRSSGPPAVDY